MKKMRWWIFPMCFLTLGVVSHPSLASEEGQTKMIPYSPVPVDMKGKKASLVKRGSYLVNAIGGCGDCHTSPTYKTGGDPYKGEAEIFNADAYMAGGQAFGPVIKSANVTPDADGLPGHLTFEQFLDAMQRGKSSKDASKILQVMPWPVYSKMTKADLRAIYEYLRAIPSVGWE